MNNELLKAIGDMLDNKLEPIKQDVNFMKQEIGSMKVQLDENTQVLKSLEQRTLRLEVAVAEVKNDVSEVNRKVDDLRNDLTTVESMTAKNWQELIKMKQENRRH